MKKLLIWGFILLGFLASAHAQEAVFDLGEWTVTGSKGALTVGQSPAGVTVLTARQIENLSPLDLGEILEKAAGLEVTNQGGLGQLSTAHIRGGFTTQTLILLNGSPLNNPNLGTFDLSQIPVQDIEKIEIVRGPYSSLYGPYAVDGVVNLITKKPKKQFQAALSLSGGAFETGVTSLKVSCGNQNTSLVFIPTFKSSNGARPNSVYQARDGFFSLEQKIGRGNFNFNLESDSSRVGLPGVQPARDYALRNATQQLMGGELLTSPFDHTVNASQVWNGGFEQGNFKLQFYNHTQAPKYHYERINLGQRQTEDDQALTQFNGLEANYRFKLKDNQLTLGGGLENAHFNYNSQLTDSGIPQAPTSYAGNRLSRFYYLEGLLKSKPLVITLGLRYDRPSDFAPQLSPRVSALYRLDSKTSLRAAYGTAYRPPTLNDLYWPSDAFARGNPQLGPETTNSFETGLERLFSDKCLFRAVFFKSRTKNMIMWAPTGPMGDYGNIWQPDNVNRVSKQGWELQLNLKPAPRLELEFSQTAIQAWQYNLELTDYVSNQMQVVKRTAANVPAYNFKAGLNYRFTPGWRFSLDAQLMGSKLNYYSQYGVWPDTGVTMAPKTLAAYSVYGVKLEKAVKIGEKESAIYLKGENLFNAAYAESFGNSISDRNYPMPGAAFYLGTELKF